MTFANVCQVLIKNESLIHEIIIDASEYKESTFSFFAYLFVSPACIERYDSLLATSG